MAEYPHYMTLWFSHGPGCGSTNVAAKAAEEARASAGATIAQVAAVLAANLKKAGQRYGSTDSDQRDILGDQLR